MPTSDGDCHAEFILSHGRFFDRLRMSGELVQNDTGRRARNDSREVRSLVNLKFGIV